MCKEGSQANIRPGLEWEPYLVAAKGLSLSSRTKIRDGSGLTDNIQDSLWAQKITNDSHGLAFPSFSK